VNIVDIGQRTTDMNLFYHKCITFFDLDNDNKLKLISENNNFKELIQIIHEFKSFSSLIGKLSKNNVETPITIDLRRFVVDKNNFKTEEIYSVELSGDPLLFIDVDIYIEEYRKQNLKNFFKKNAIRILNMMKYNNNQIIFKNYEVIKQFLINSGLKKNYIKNIDEEFELINYSELHNLFKNFNFDEYLLNSEFDRIKYATKMNINNKKFFQQFYQTFMKFKIMEWKHYFILNTIYSFIKRVFNIGNLLIFNI
jgi:predicted metalloendopeptidase